MPLPTYARFLAHRKWRKATESALSISATLPDSGLTSAQNSQAASAAVVELVQALDETIGQLDLDGTIFVHRSDAARRLNHL
jgi:hypothetical protein